MPQISYSEKGSISVNPSIVTEGLTTYLDPSNKRCSLSGGTTFNNLVNSNQFVSISDLLSSDNGKVRFFNFNSSRDLHGTDVSNLTSCCIQAWVRNTEEDVAESVDNFLSIAGTATNNATTVNFNTTIFNFTLTTELTSIGYNNFYNNTTSVTVPGVNNASLKADNKIKLTSNAAFNGSHYYFIAPVLLQDLRENNINWSIYFQSSFWRDSGNLNGNGTLSIIFNSLFGQTGQYTGGRPNNDLMYRNIPNSFAVTYNAGDNKVDFRVQGEGTSYYYVVNGNFAGEASATAPFNLSTNTGENSNIIHNWIEYNKSTKNLSIFISQSNTKPSTPLLVVTNIEPYAYLKVPKIPYVRDIFVSRVNSTSAYSINISRFGNIGFSLGDKNISSQLDAMSGEWSLVTLNFERDRIRLFKNLTYIQTVKLENRFNTNFISIGDANHMDVGQVLYYNRALTDSEIINNYKNFVYRYNIDGEGVEKAIKLLPLDPDTVDYVNRAGITDNEEIYRLDSFIIGLKILNLYDKVNCWPLTQGQNSSIGSTVYSFGSAYPNVPGNIVGTFTRSVCGVTLNSNSYIDTLSPGITGDNERSVMMVINNTPSSGFLGGWGTGGLEWPIPGTNFDTDTINFLNKFSPVPDEEKIALDKFVKGIKKMGLWSNMVCWPMISTQNANGTNTVYSLGGGGTFDGTILNSPTWTNQGFLINSGNNRKIVTTKKNINYNKRTLYAVGRTDTASFFNRARYIHTGFGEPGFMQFTLKCAGMSINDSPPAFDQCGVGIGFATDTTNAQLSSMIVCASPRNSLGTWRSHAAVFGNKTLINYSDAMNVGSLTTASYWAEGVTDGTVLCLMDSHDPALSPTEQGACLRGCMAFGADFDVDLSQSQITSLDNLYKSTLGRNLPMSIPQNENDIIFPGNSYSLKKPNANSVFQEFWYYDLTSISSDRGVGMSYGDGSSTTWSNKDISIEVLPSDVGTKPGNFFINRGYSYDGEKNNETYSFALKSTAKLTESDFYNIYDLYKNTLGADLFLPSANVPINFDNDTLLYLARLGEQKAYTYKKGLNDLIINLKGNNLWNDYVYFFLGTNVNTSNGILHSLGNYTPGINYTARIIGSGSSRNLEGISLTTSSYLSTDVPASTGKEDRFLMVHHDNATSPGFMMGEGVNGTDQAFAFKRVNGGDNIILDAWFNWSNDLPRGTYTCVDLNNSRYAYYSGPSYTYYHGYMNNLNTQPGNLVLNQANVNYNSERSSGDYYFIVKAKKSVVFPSSSTPLSIAGLAYNFIGRLNPNSGAWSSASQGIPSTEVVEYATLSGMYLTYNDYNRFKNFISNIGSLYNNMVCWPLRQGQNAGGINVSRYTSPTVYSFGGLPQASAVRIGPITENSSGAFYTSNAPDASGRIVTTSRKLTAYSERTLYAAANVNSHNFYRRSRLIYTSWSEPAFVEYGGSSQNGLILEGFGFGSQMCNTQSPNTSGNIATVNISSPTLNTFNTFGTIYSGSRISQYRNRVILGSAGEEQYAVRPNTPGWASTLTDARQLTLMNSEDEPLPFGGSMIGSLAFAADFNIGLTTEQLTAFDNAYRTTLGEGITFQ